MGNKSSDVCKLLAFLETSLEYLSEHLSPKEYAWLENDVDTVTIAFVGAPPDSDNQHAIKDSCLVISCVEAELILMSRISNCEFLKKFYLSKFGGANVQ